MKQKLYVVGGVSKKHDVMQAGTVTELELSWADGMIGVLPVFNDKEKAEKYADNEFTILTIMVEKI